MDEFWTDEQFSAVKQILLAVIEEALRPLYTELSSQQVVIEAFKKARPNDVAMFDHLLDLARNSQETKTSVDRRIGQLLQVANSLDQSNRDQTIAEVIRQYFGSTSVQ